MALGIGLIAAWVLFMSWMWITIIDREIARKNGAHRLTRATAKRIRRGRP